MNSMKLQNVMEERDLGIVIRDKQCIATVKQANKVLVPKMIKRNFVERYKDITMALYRSG